MTKTRVGMVGAGWIGQVHARALGRFDDVELVAIASRRPESAGKLAATTGARAFDDYRVMLDAGGLDAVIVCVPPDLEAEVDLAVVERGFPLLTEKPIAVVADG